VTSRGGWSSSWGLVTIKKRKALPIKSIQNTDQQLPSDPSDNNSNYFTPRLGVESKIIEERHIRYLMVNPMIHTDNTKKIEDFFYPKMDNIIGK
jgi:hypothetical protein